MASLAVLDRLVRSDIPARFRAVGMTAEATQFESAAVIDRAARVSARASDLRVLEDRIIAAWDPVWDVGWEPRRHRALLVTVAEITDQISTGTAAERLLFKTALRVALLLMARAGV